MSRNSKIIIISCLITFSIISIGFNFIKTQNNTQNGLSTADNGTYTGNYDGDISILYFNETSQTTLWSYQNSSTTIIPHNESFSGREFKIHTLEIWTDNFWNVTTWGENIIADNISNQISLTPALAYTQEFTVEDLIAIDTISIYLNYSSVIIEPTTDSYIMILQIYNEDFTEEIDWMYLEGHKWDLEEWVDFYPRPNIFEPEKKYNFFFYLFVPKDPPVLIPNDFWRAEKYNSSTYN
ncbi:MAG: hypothetical protein ACFFD2_26305, partial [Promethearchaeota archaeon]